MPAWWISRLLLLPLLLPPLLHPPFVPLVTVSADSISRWGPKTQDSPPNGDGLVRGAVEKVATPNGIAAHCMHIAASPRIDGDEGRASNADSSCELQTPPYSSRRLVVQQVCSSPRLYLVENFASKEEIEHIIESSRPRLTPSHPGTVTGTRYELPIDDDPVLETVRERMMAIFPDLDTDFQSTFRVRRYQPDGSYHPPHLDYYQSSDDPDNKVLVLTIMLYLTTPEEGGETYFPKANSGSGYAFQPVAGNVAAWWSIVGDEDVDKGAGNGHRDHAPGTRDQRTEHEGRKVRKGEKWNATYFVYANPLQAATVRASKVISAR